MTEKQIIELLGPPDSKWPFGFEYDLGPKRGIIRIDSEALNIHFDQLGKVSRQEIFRD